MSALQVGILAVIAIIINRLKRGRSLAMLAISALAIYWLQPIQEPINLTFWLPTCTLIFSGFCWLITSEPEVRTWKNNWMTVLVMGGVILLVSFNRYFQIEYFFVTDTPRVQWVSTMLVGIFALGLVLARVKNFPALIFWIAMVGLVVVLVVLKTPSVLTMLIEMVSGLRGKEAGEAYPIAWLGFSYVAFRLLHTILDRRTGRLPSLSLAEYVNYVIFFPAFTAGPIDRIERFTRNLNLPLELNQGAWLTAGTRLFRGLFKKFVIADGLAWFALSDVLTSEIHSVVWLWILLYAYSMRIYFDFSGYTDIAIGLAMLTGIQLPENFDAPYLKPNLTQFWNSWHMTLTQWFRSYFFNPLTRSMRSAQRPVPQWLMILFAQLATLTLIGLWHSITWGFLCWGIWHGIGLFIHNRWSEWLKSRPWNWNVTFIKYSGIFVTFHYVTLGWLFFFIPDPAMAWNVMLKLFGGA